jgi:hypothetical protein
VCRDIFLADLKGVSTDLTGLLPIHAGFALKADCRLGGKAG